MNNFEKIKAMNIEEMAELLSKGCCIGDFTCHDCICADDKCLNTIKQWLELESENTGCQK